MVAAGYAPAPVKPTCKRGTECKYYKPDQPNNLNTSEEVDLTSPSELNQ